MSQRHGSGLEENVRIVNAVAHEIKKGELLQEKINDGLCWKI